MDRKVKRIEIYSLGLPRLFDFLLHLFSSAGLDPIVTLQLVYNDPRSTPSDDQSQDGSSYCPSLSPSSTKDIMGQVCFDKKITFHRRFPGLWPTDVQKILSPYGPDVPTG